ncbi:hypothetical protein P152DRAFT_208066 [Eremomyces bilateralis CBS 781.70]|uniref:Uncharacterized protein n=1 Tax=Eremomyces bilateralis CBS 781.70 TaxID=1392243 RepID=A0A6G1FSU0_9PEZI|nr:uncharacterized protein P152DRAFT_208066 [Eremomyces bilateralis CBS 781.70]KAF1808751.1 hypothetical protein P152DRAFT_208066 [Eremomyces bilateralis CBS 781.70]
MLRLPSRQGLRAFCKSVPSPLRYPLQARRTHSLQEPFSGPPSYATLFERFSPSNPSPLHYYSRLKAEENIARGTFVDIHDIGAMDPKDYDVLITDIDDNTLHKEISDRVGIPYLKEATKDEADKVADTIRGFVYGRKFRMILPCALTINEKAHWVFFIVDSGAPLTYISTQVAQTFKLNEDEDPWNGYIAGHKHAIYMAPPDSHFANINILGGDFCHMNRLRPWVDDEHRAVTYYIGNKWDVTPKL